MHQLLFSYFLGFFSVATFSVEADSWLSYSSSPSQVSHINEFIVIHFSWRNHPLPPLFLLPSTDFCLFWTVWLVLIFSLFEDRVRELALARFDKLLGLLPLLVPYKFIYTLNFFFILLDLWEHCAHLFGLFPERLKHCILLLVLLGQWFHLRLKGFRRYKLFFEHSVD